MLQYLIPLGILSWLAIFYLQSNAYIIPGNGGGGAPQAAAPAAPAPAPDPKETSAQAIQAQIDAIPKQLAAQQEFGPQFTQLELDNLKQFGPQFAEAGLGLSQQYGEDFARQMIAEQDILDPSRAAGSKALTEYLQQGPGELSPEDLQKVQESSRAAAASRGLSQSGFSADDEVSRIFGARQNLKSQYLNVALSASGRLPAASTGSSTVNPGNTNSGQLVQNVAPTTFFGGQAAQNQFGASIFNTQSNIFGTQQQALTSNRGQNMALIGQLGSSALSA